jgi:uncharacterized protein
MSKKIELQIADIAPSGSTSGAYAMVLAETEGSRRLPIVIGGAEAQAIAIELEQLTPTRPLTHDLFKNLAISFQIEVEEVVIYNLVEGIFFARLIASLDGKRAEIDARTSDAVALAVRFGCPIYCMEFIMDQAGVNTEENLEAVSFEEPDITVGEDAEQEISQHVSIDELQRQLESALEREEYEKASRIRDEINKRTGK